MSERIAVLGSGRMGDALVAGLAPHHTVLWGSREPERIAARAGELGATPVDHARALDADIVFSALWHRDELPFARRHRAALAGNILVSMANPYNEDYTDFTTPPDSSAAEALAAAAPESVVVGAFKNTFWGVFAKPEFPEGLSDVLVTGDDDDARRRVMAALAPMPFRFLDAGPLSRNRTIERMTLLARELSVRYGHHPYVSWRLLGKPEPEES
ncbi:hypothetical protein LX15_003249 [Streptoalloteichus tenebrarius]|uniref:Pyrroline-5-carboxylate reductase catalytic N-terminal domain-containing protein n=1 Tax=Streptoalloteichus tenebrarius (strain ATCC 17920 / DSM 40477 / JCM 4838 / CBS 697.72 / NBRC 16177 / NCIMB 11028 / NRRL B-12390 / A12253. 1 / ISP 5477) TaxID=1933 RepID=A0ABT1HVJ5_STRSD|nr:NAD(P)-binding domain-containing protein [Streptoalloteichus tenebrarius]MCP2259544.1 hypothetical protein [Streptoalloteichus tenebrarius]BFF01373.1 hypothetical protein GCM10020241_30480 [Streptoalloteichus tenebrarius]